MTDDTEAEAEARALAHRWFDDFWNAGRTELMDEILAPGCVYTVHDAQGLSHGLEEFRGLMGEIRAAFPDIHLRVNEMVADAGRAAIWWTAIGTHSGHGFGVPPTGVAFKVDGMGFITVDGGKVSRIDEVWDRAGMLRAIGIPAS